MFSVTITEKGGSTVQRDFEQPEVTIGRIQGNDIVLPKSNISKRHARIVNNSGAFVVIDSKSTNGTYINGKRIDGPYDLRVGDKIFVGDFTLEVDGAAAAVEQAPAASRKASPPPPPADAGSAAADDDILADDEWGGGAGISDDWSDDWSRDEEGTSEGDHTSLDAQLLTPDDLDEPPPPGEPPPPDLKTAPPSEAKPRRPARPTVPVPIPPGAAAMKPAAAAPASAPAPKAKAPEPLPNESSTALRQVHERLLRSLDLRRMDVERMGDEELRTRTRTAVEEIVDAMATSGELPADLDTAQLVSSVLDEALGLGPIEDLLQDDSVNEILVNGAKQVYVERHGKLEPSDRVFSSDQAVMGVIERIVAPLGRRIDESSPMVDARLKDGSRVNAIVPPLALGGPTLTIRKFTREPLRVDDLVAGGTMTAAMAQFLETCVEARKNIVISGGTGSGKTTTLNVLSSYIPEDERIITIEDAAELKLDQAHVVRLESRPPNIEGRGAITIRDLVRNALRMRPDRIVVGECRGGEALDMLQAMNTGHDGSLTTVHANGPRDALSRLETMVLMSGMDLPVRAIRDQIASAVDIIVQQTRFPDGSRRVTHISEVTGMEVDVISMQDIFVFEQEGFDADGRVTGHSRPTGFIPRFFETLKGLGIEADLSIFQQE